MNHQTWQERVALLETYAKQLDLRLAEHGATPENHLVPLIEMGDNEAWTCPHCGTEQVTMNLLEVERRQGESITYEPAGLMPAGAWAVEGDAEGESETISYLCPDCSGFVYPEEEVLWQ